MTRKTSKKSKTFKVLTIGDGAIGKTSLLLTLIGRTDLFTKDGQPNLSYTPTVFEQYSHTIFSKDEIPYELDLWDSAGQEEFDSIRQLTYDNIDLFLVCFSVDSVDSLTNVEEKWVGEIEKYSPNTECILVGTKSDLRKDESCFDRILPDQMIRRVKNKYKFFNCYVETSSVTQDNIMGLSQKMVQVLADKEEEERNNNESCLKCCNLM